MKPGGRDAAATCVELAALSVVLSYHRRVSRVTVSPPMDT